MARAGGFSLIEVLMTLMLLATGLAGLAGLQARATVASIEAWQRTQALLLAEDMASRIAANKPQALGYVGADYGPDAPASCAAQPGVERDLCVWANALRGAAEREGGSAVATLAGGRGCIESVSTNRLAVVVVWQGMLPTAPPATGCGRGRYGNDALRRAIVMPMQLATLAGS